MKKQFEVLAGQHIEPIGQHDKKTYLKGDIVVSDKNLVGIFPLKFKDLGLATEEVENGEEAAMTVAGAEATETSPARGKRGKISPNPNE